MRPAKSINHHERVDLSTQEHFVNYSLIDFGDGVCFLVSF